LANPIYRYFTKAVDAIVVPGRESYDLFLGFGADEEKIFIAPDAVDNTEINEKYLSLARDRHEIRKKYGYSNEVLVIYVGQLVPRKGVDILIKAFSEVAKEINNLHLVIVGSGPESSNLIRLAREKNLDRVSFTDWVGDDVKYELLTISDLFILPTMADSWGLVVNEAMCCRLPVITTNAAGCHKDLIIQGVTGKHINAGDIDELKGALKAVVQNEDELSRMGERARNHILSNFSIEKEAQGFLEAI
jgi:glycosyltransferase involved in cell wall biosynthesis